MKNRAINLYYPKHYVQPGEVHESLRNNMLVDGFDFVLDLYSSQGSNFIDARTGRSYIDFFTCFASMPIGMNHPKMTDQSFVDYIGHIALNKPSNSDIYSDVMASFVKTFFATADLDSFKYAFFISGGALAVENALKTAFDWKVRKNFKKGHQTEKGHQIIHFKDAFHGRSGYTMSLTNTDPRKVAYYPKFEWPRIDNPCLRFPVNENVLDDVINAENKALSQIKQAFADNKDDIAAIIIEPIQGEGGDNHFRREFLESLRNLADENETLLIFDEVQTGVGITGKWWAHQNYDVVPDIMVFGKKMQICGIVATSKLDEVEDNVFHSSSRINSTWGGNLTDMARATKYLEIIEDEKLVDNAAVMGNELREEIESLCRQFPTLLSNARGQGLFRAFDMPDHDFRNAFIDRCFKDGLFILPSGKKSVRFRPALNIDSEQMAAGIEIMKTALSEISK